MTTIDLVQPIVTAVVGIVATGLGIVGAAVLVKLRERLGVAADDARAVRFGAGVEKALSLGLQRAGVLPATSTPEQVQNATESPASPAVQTAANYLEEVLPDIIAALGKTRPQIEDAIIARVPDLMSKTLYGQQPPKDAGPVALADRTELLG